MYHPRFQTGHAHAGGNAVFHHHLQLPAQLCDRHNPYTLQLLTMSHGELRDSTSHSGTCLVVN